MNPIAPPIIKSNPYLIAFGIVLVGLIGVVDFMSGTEIAFYIAYLIPISIFSWYVGRRAGILTAIASATLWFIANIANLHSYGSPLIHFWNGFVRLGVFLIVAYLLSTLKATLEQLKSALENEKELARKDSLTEVANERAFYEAINIEINIARRYENPFTVVYIDMDNLKLINNSYGLNTGVAILRLVAETIKRNIRAQDKVARLGNNEFAILLSKAGSEAAQMMMPKLQTALLKLVQENDWPVNFNIGVVTYTKAPNKIDEVIVKTDELMYEVKRDSKNTIKYEVVNSLATIP